MQTEQELRDLISQYPLPTEQEWQVMPLLRKRLAIAADIIRSTLARQYEPVTGSYAAFRSPYKENGDIRTLLATPYTKCSCCEVGAAFLSLCRIENKATTYEIDFGRDGNSRARLVDIFGERNIDLMETAFEHEKFGYQYDATQKAILFGYEYVDVYVRMIAINVNIIKNNGEFIP